MSDEPTGPEGPGAPDDTAPDDAAPDNPPAFEETAVQPAPAPPRADGAPPPADDLPAALEAILFVVDSPVPPASLAAALGSPVAEVDRALHELRAGYDERGAGIELREVAGGVRIYTRPAHAPHVERFLQDGQRARLSQAALETLAVIAYRQPVTRSRIGAIRGVNVDGVVRTLLMRELIVDDGTDPDTGGALLRTTPLFLEKMGLRAIEELPSLAPLLPEIDQLDGAEA